MGGITSAASITTGAGLSGAGTVASPLALNTLTTNAVGTVGLFVLNPSAFSNGTFINYGTTVSASTITSYWRQQRICSCGATFQTISASISLSGTWMFLGSVYNAQLFIRIA